MFTVYKGNMQLSLTDDEHCYRVEHITMPAALFFWFWSCCLQCVECTYQCLSRRGLTSLLQQRQQRGLTVGVNRGQGLKKTGVTALEAKHTLTPNSFITLRFDTRWRRNVHIFPSKHHWCHLWRDGYKYDSVLCSLMILILRWWVNTI